MQLVKLFILHTLYCHG